MTLGLMYCIATTRSSEIPNTDNGDASNGYNANNDS